MNHEIMRKLCKRIQLAQFTTITDAFTIFPFDKLLNTFNSSHFILSFIWRISLMISSDFVVFSHEFIFAFSHWSHQKFLNLQSPRLQIILTLSVVHWPTFRSISAHFHPSQLQVHLLHKINVTIASLSVATIIKVLFTLIARS